MPIATGEQAAVKLWLKEEGELDRAFEAFGIAHRFVKARRMNESTYVYAYAIEPMYWSQTISNHFPMKLKKEDKIKPKIITRLLNFIQLSKTRNPIFSF